MPLSLPRATPHVQTPVRLIPPPVTLAFFPYSPARTCTASTWYTNYCSTRIRAARIHLHSRAIRSFLCDDDGPFSVFRLVRCYGERCTRVSCNYHSCVYRWVGRCGTDCVSLCMCRPVFARVLWRSSFVLLCSRALLSSLGHAVEMLYCSSRTLPLFRRAAWCICV